jgi:hypothetical protein
MNNSYLKYYSPKFLKNLIDKHSVYQRAAIERDYRPINLSVGGLRALYAQLFLYSLIDLLTLEETNNLIKMIESKDDDNKLLASVIIKNKETEFKKLERKGFVAGQLDMIILNYYNEVYTPSWNALISLNKISV